LSLQIGQPARHDATRATSNPLAEPLMGVADDTPLRFSLANHATDLTRLIGQRLSVAARSDRNPVMKAAAILGTLVLPALARLPVRLFQE